MNELYNSIYNDLVTRYPDRTVWHLADIAEYEGLHKSNASTLYNPGKKGIDTATYARLKAGYAIKGMNAWQKRILKEARA